MRSREARARTRGRAKAATARATETRPRRSEPFGALLLGMRGDGTPYCRYPSRSALHASSSGPRSARGCEARARAAAAQKPSRTRDRDAPATNSSPSEPFRGLLLSMRADDTNKYRYRPRSGRSEFISGPRSARGGEARARAAAAPKRPRARDRDAPATNS